MITDTGIWGQEEADDAHIFSYRVAKWIGHKLKWHTTVIDFGCGRGDYLKYLSDIGFKHCIGVEGYKLDNFEYQNIEIHDLTMPLDLGHSGNLICIEVFEHIPPQYQEQFVQNIVNHCNGKLIISVAVPGQEGLGHVNCKTNEEVIEIFTAHGFVFNEKQTAQIRNEPENFVSYLRNTLLIFDKA